MQHIENSNKKSEDPIQHFIDKSKSDKPNYFNVFAQKTADFVGTAWVFICVFTYVVIWLCSGPFFDFSDTWQLIMNTVSSVVTFLIVFIIQSTQNRDTKAIKIKLDELIRSNELAHNSIINLENLSDSEIKELEEHYTRISKSTDRDGEHASSAELKDEEEDPIKKS